MSCTMARDIPQKKTRWDVLKTELTRGVCVWRNCYSQTDWITDKLPRRIFKCALATTLTGLLCGRMNWAEWAECDCLLTDVQLS